MTIARLIRKWLSSIRFEREQQWKHPERINWHGQQPSSPSYPKHIGYEVIDDQGNKGIIVAND